MQVSDQWFGLVANVLKTQKPLTFNFTYRSSVSSSSMELCVMSFEALRSEISSYENNTSKNMELRRFGTSSAINAMF